MKHIAGNWLEQQATQTVCRMLTDQGACALFVGGCVRNALLGAAVNDVDIATDAHPNQVMAWAKAINLKSIPTGIEHGTITVVSGGMPFEITTFRRDVATDGRRAVVAFSGDIFEDARRRDFTMNAIYARPDGAVVDPLGGMADLQARRIRFIEDADKRIKEDYLRILRFFRFSAWYGDPELGFDAEALAAIADNLDGLAGLSKERIGAEILKTLGASDPTSAVATMRALGVLSRVLNGSDDRALGPLVHLEQQTDTSVDPLRRLVSLAGEMPETDLRLSKAQARKLRGMRDAAISTAGAEELGYRFGIDFATSAILLRSSLLETIFKPEDLDAAQRAAGKIFTVTANDLMPVLSGPILGAHLKELEARWIRSGFSLTKAQLLSDYRPDAPEG